MSSEEIRPPAAYLRLARDGASPAAESGDSGPASCRTLGLEELKEALGGKLLEEAYRLLAACRKESREGNNLQDCPLFESVRRHTAHSVREPLAKGVCVQSLQHKKPARMDSPPYMGERP